MIHRPLANVLPLPKPTTTHGHGVVYTSDGARRWTATFAANIVAFQATGESPIPALQALATTLADWVASSREGLGLQLRWTRRGAQLGLSLVVSVAGDSPATLEPMVQQARRDLGHVLESARAVRGELVEDVWQVEALREAEGFPAAVVAQPCGGGKLPLAAEALDPAALGRVVDLLLTGDTETTLVVSMRRARDEAAIQQLGMGISAALAESRGRAEGARFTSGAGTSIRRLPEDLVPLVGAVGILERDPGGRDYRAGHDPGGAGSGGHGDFDFAVREDRGAVVAGERGGRVPDAPDARRGRDSGGAARPARRARGAERGPFARERGRAGGRVAVARGGRAGAHGRPRLAAPPVRVW